MNARHSEKAASRQRIALWTLCVGFLGMTPMAVHAQSAPPDSPGSSGGPEASTVPPSHVPPKPRAKQAEAMPGGQAGTEGLPQSIRWTEDWSKRPAPNAPLLDRLRHIPLGSDDDVYISLGGEERIYYTNWHHSTLGLQSNDSNNPVQSRLRLIADLHLGPYLRGYLELGDNREFGEDFATPPNRDKMDIYQAFVDVTVPLGSAGKVTFRPGRFEMPLGNGKLVGVREGLNMRFTYQGIRATYILPGKLSVDAFALRPVAVKPGTFDDGPNHTSTFNGVYVSAPRAVLGIGTDAYWYEVNRDTATLREGTGSDRRTNLGARLWARNTRWDLDLEADHQSGTFDAQVIRAYAIMFEGGYTFARATWSPRLGLRANVFSGDDKANDGKAGTFVPASARLPLLSEAAFFNLSNLMDFFPSLTVKPRPDVVVMIGPDFLWRNSRADGIYIGSTGASFAPYASSRAIGTDLNLEADWQANKYLQFKLFETYFAASNSFSGDGGRNGNYFGLQADAKF